MGLRQTPRQDAGIDPTDTKAVRRFDKKREGSKTSNLEWQNPHDPEAKVGRTKHGATDMTYKPEHMSDLGSGAIIDVHVRPGDAADNDSSTAQRVLAAVGTVLEVAPEIKEKRHPGISITADEGYFAVEQIAELQRHAPAHRHRRSPRRKAPQRRP